MPFPLLPSSRFLLPVLHIVRSANHYVLGRPWSHLGPPVHTEGEEGYATEEGAWQEGEGR